MTPVEPASTHWARIYMAGSVADAERVCRDWAFQIGGCVTVTPTEYVYSGGQESGFVVGFINYPRFPLEPEQMLQRAKTLARMLAEALCQRSYTIETTAETLWFTRPMPFEQNTEAA